MKRFRAMLMAVAVASLCGCNENTDDTGTEPNGLFDTQQEALQRAHEVEGDVLEAARRQREKIEEQGG